MGPAAASLRDDAVRTAVETAAGFGVPMVLAADSNAMAGHARSIGLIPAESQGDISKDVLSDQQLPETGAQAVEDALESFLLDNGKDSD